MNHIEYLDKQLVNWAGRSPANNESTNKKKNVHISNIGQYLKPLLVQCALSSIKDKNSYFGIKYCRIKKRRGRKKSNYRNSTNDAYLYISHDSYG